MTNKFSIKIASLRSGLTTHVIRVWEKRYGAVKPERTSTNRRIYSEEEIERLRLLNKAVKAGYSIGRIAELDTKEVIKLLMKDDTELRNREITPEDAGKEEAADGFFKEAFDHVESLNSEGLKATLTQAEMQLARPVLIDQVVVPILQKIGESWREGEIKILHEHKAIETIRNALQSMTVSQSSFSDSAKTIVFAVPAKHFHDLGALIAAVSAISEGWKAEFLGPNLPAEEIAAAALMLKARIAAVSIVYPENDAETMAELKKLRQYLPEDIEMIVGGRAAASYSKILDDLGIKIIPDMPAFRLYLSSLS